VMQNRKALELVRNYAGPHVRIMEVCGTHTHAIFQYGIRNILPENIQLISGPGCPVCVTETGYIDEAIFLAKEKNVTITTFGDLVRVPGTEVSMAGARAEGARIKIVYSPLDALQYAEEHPEEKVVFLAVGFETTTPASCIAVKQAKEKGLKNFSLLVANKTMDQAYRVLKGSTDAFLYPGHVSTITGMRIYRELVKEGISGAVCGFTADEILTAIAVILKRLQEGKPFAENCYPRVVTEEGSPAGRAMISEVMQPCDAVWRGIGVIPGSGLELRDEYSDFDARKVYSVPVMHGRPNPACRCGDILMGRIKPPECPLFGKTCTPDHPVGACMVSSEGTCSAYYKYAL
jgi:hydrogenase expression/formation protein HypD